jgi:hypothetical protein
MVTTTLNNSFIYSIGPDNILKHDIDGLDSYDAYQILKKLIEQGYAVKMAYEWQKRERIYRIIAEKIIPQEPES